MQKMQLIDKGEMHTTRNTPSPLISRVPNGTVHPYTNPQDAAYLSIQYPPIPFVPAQRSNRSRPQTWAVPHLMRVHRASCRSSTAHQSAVRIINFVNILKRGSGDAEVVWV